MKGLILGAAALVGLVFSAAPVEASHGGRAFAGFRGFRGHGHHGGHFRQRIVIVQQPVIAAPFHYGAIGACDGALGIGGVCSECGYSQGLGYGGYGFSGFSGGYAPAVIHDHGFSLRDVFRLFRRFDRGRDRDGIRGFRGFGGRDFRGGRGRGRGR